MTVVAVLDGVAVLLITAGAVLTLFELVRPASEWTLRPEWMGMAGVLLIAFGLVWLGALLAIGLIL